MPIIVNLDVMLAKRKMRSKVLAEQIGITEQNLSLLKSGKVKGVRFDTLDKICEALECQPGDLLEYRPADSDDFGPVARFARAMRRSG
jgi:putative transcriptional regulator